MPAVALVVVVCLLMSGVSLAENFNTRLQVDSDDPGSIPWGFEAPYWPDMDSGVGITEIHGVLALGAARTLEVDYIGFDAPAIAPRAQAETRGILPRALAMDDYDEDGVRDLIVAQATPGGGRLALYRGNVAALFPRSAPAERMRELGRFTRAPFLSPAMVVNSPLAPDFLGTGDFDNDGHRDVVVGAWGSQHLITWLGDGQGGLFPGPNIPLAGGLTAAAVGDVHRPDGIADLAVAVDGSEGGQLAVFNGPEGVLNAAPEVLDLSYPATAIVLERLDGDPLTDLAVAAGSELILLKGRDRTYSGRSRLPRDSAGAEGEPTSMSLPFEILAMASGNFLDDAKYRPELALLASDGAVHALPRNVLANLVPGNVEIIGSESLPVIGAAGAGVKKLVKVRGSNATTDDLLLLGDSVEAAELLVASPEAHSSRYQPLGTGTGMAHRHPLPESSGTVAAITARLSVDAHDDLVLLQAGRSEPSVQFLSAPLGGGGSFLVNDMSIFDSGPLDGICDIDPVMMGDQCNLNEALSEAANFTTGTVTIGFAGDGPYESPGQNSITVPLTIDGGAGGGDPNVQIILRSQLVLDAAPSVIRGVRIIGTSLTFRQNGGGNLFENNWVGLDASGTAIISSTAGLTINTNNAQTTFGGTAMGAGNVIAARSMLSSFSDGDVFRGNKIGTDKTGTLSLGTQPGTVLGIAGPSTLVGGTAAGDGNLISGNQFAVGVAVTGAGALVQGNLIGTDVSGASALGNRSAGVTVGSAADMVTIGGTAFGAGNVISANSFPSDFGGLVITSTGTVTVQGNIIGADISGMVGLGNRGVGISLQTGGHTIGGTTGSAANTIVDSQADSGGLRFAGNGIEMPLAAASENLIQGNRIGVGLLLTPLGNQGHGIIITSSAADNQIGGTDAGAGNEIMHNGGTGVLVSGNAGQGNRILGNEVADNGGLGIDLSQATDPDGPTANDPGDGDGGPNDLQNYPVIDSVDPVGGTLQGSLASKPNTTYRVEVFANAACDPSGFGEGATFLDATEVTTDGNGDAGFMLNPGGLNNPTATATDIAIGDTSEFSACFPAEAPSAVVNSVGDDPDNNIGDGDCDTGGMIDREGVLEPECTLRASFEEQLPQVLFDIPQDQYPLTDAPLIQPASPFPPITHTVTVDPGSQPGVGAVQVDFGQSGPGGRAPGDANQPLGPCGINAGAGFEISGPDVRFKPGFAIFCYKEYGFWLRGSLATLDGVIVGSDYPGTTPGLGGDIGILISDPDLGQIDDDQNKVINSQIVSNSIAGIQIAGADSRANEVSNNFIGTTGSGLTVLGNGTGVLILDAAANTVSENVIARSLEAGLRIEDPDPAVSQDTTENQIIGNYIGTDRQSRTNLGNVLGIAIENAADNTIHDNVVAGNIGAGVRIRGAEASGNILTGNFLGTDRLDSGMLGNDTGITIMAPGNIVGGESKAERNLIGNNLTGIRIEGPEASFNVVLGNYIGTTADGLQQLVDPPLQTGISIFNASRNTIGGGSSAQNLISGNRFGIEVSGSEARFNGIASNLIGTDATGATPLANTEQGVVLNNDSRSNWIGQYEPAPGIRFTFGNVISANGDVGVLITGGASENRVKDNFIGTDDTATLVLGNGHHGVSVSGTITEPIRDSALLPLGGATPSISGNEIVRNTIAFNSGDGVAIEGDTTDNSISRNSIFANDGLGIDLGSDGVTANDPGDPDPGPNDLRNFPVIDSVLVDPTGILVVRGTVEGPATKPIVVEAFDNLVCDGKGHGEGELYQGSDVVRPKAAGPAPFTIVSIWDGGSQFTTTATDDDGGPTSEFSECVVPFVQAEALLINEVDAITTDDTEHIELSSAGVGGQSLTGRVLVLYEGGTDTSYAAFDLDAMVTDVNGYFVLGNAAAPSVDLVFDDLLLHDGPAAVALYDGDAASFPNGTPVTTNGLIDAAVYGPAGAPDAELLVLLNPGQPQLDEAANGNGTTDSSQRCPDSSGGERYTDTYQASPPTPGDENSCVVCYIEPSQTTADENQDVTLTATVLVNAVTPMAGIGVDFDVLSGPNTGETASLMTDANGEAVFSYTGLGGAGEDAVFASGMFGGVPFFCEAGVNWLVAPIFIHGFE